jgi:septal ring factor EnvC (AmiA/AmiB activator)
MEAVMTDDAVVARLGQLESAIGKASDLLARLRDDNARLGREVARLGEENGQLKREVAKLGDERRQVIGQIDMLLKDIGKLDLE